MCRICKEADHTQVAMSWRSGNGEGDFFGRRNFFQNSTFCLIPFYLNQQPGNNTMKVIAMFVLLCVDLSFNCSFDYDDYNISDSDLNIVPLAIQLIIEISIFLVLFLTMAETYLFRVGLLGEL